MNFRITAAATVAVLAVVLSACAVPAALEPVREAAVGMPIGQDGVTRVSATVPDWSAGEGTIMASSDFRGREVTFVTGTISAAGQLQLELQVPPREALLEVRDAWLYDANIISSNPQARLAFIYYYGVHQGRQQPVGWLFMDTDEDFEDDAQVGDTYAAYVYSNEPTRIRINDTATGGHRYIADLNLARGWNRVVTEVISVATGVVTMRETIDYGRDVTWRYEAAD